MAGILAGIKLQEKGIGNIAIYEKADRIGGTWRENTYPGLTCDVPSHHYTYSFERNPDWSRHLPPGPEIQNYFERVTKKYGVDKLIRFNTEITRANFKNGRWQLTLAGGETDHADVIIAATGVLHMPSLPEHQGHGRLSRRHVSHRPLGSFGAAARQAHRRCRHGLHRGADCLGTGGQG